MQSLNTRDQMISFWALLSCVSVYHAVQGGSNFWIWINSSSVTIQMKAIKHYFPMLLFIMLYKVVLTFESG